MKFYKIECGNMKGIVSGSTPGVAFRKLVLSYKPENRIFAALARFKETDAKGGNVLIFLARGKRKRAVWMYQEPVALYKS